MRLALEAAFLTAGLFLGILAFFVGGRWLGKVRLRSDPDGALQGAGPVEAAVFGLLGLLLALTFTGAASRFADRRHLIAEESNAIGTAYLRVDLVPDHMQPAMRQLFRRYLDVRIDTYRHMGDSASLQSRLDEAEGLQRQIWETAVAASRRPEVSPSTALLVLPALNAMIDITTTRAVATQDHPPYVIYYLLAGLSFVSALLVGFVTCDTGRPNWFYVLIFAVAMSLTFYVILDLEFPRQGLIRVDTADRALLDLRRSME